MGGKEEKTQISVDRPVKERAYAQVIAAGPQETNSFERKEQVSARRHEIESGRDFLYCVPPYSINVLVLEKEKEN